MNKDASFIREENEIIKNRLKQALQEIADLKIQVQKRDVRIQMLENEVRIQQRARQSREDVLSSHSAYFRGSVGSTDETVHNTSTTSEVLHPQALHPQMKESANSLSFDSAIFDEHRPLINMDFRLPEFNKSRLFGGSKKPIVVDVPLKPITHNAIKQSDFEGITKLKNILLQEKIAASEKTLFKCFFVTGIKNLNPIVEYCYPAPTEYADTILTLLYPEQPLRPKERTKSMTEINKLLVASPLKDMFVIALKQPQEQCSTDEYQYVIGCQTEDLLFRQPQYFTYSRYFCFLSDYKCIKLFMEVLTEVASKRLSYVESVQSNRQFYLSQGHDNESRLQESLTEHAYVSYFHDLMRQQIEPKLQLLLKNKFVYNQHLRVKWSAEKTLMEEIPARQNQSQLIFGYEPAVRLHNYRIQYVVAGQQRSYEENLLTFACVYMMCEKRLVIYSTSKERVSLLLLLILETIKPLQFVNPILQGCVRQSYIDYLEAPMSIVMGMWGQRKVQKGVLMRKPLKKSQSFTFGDIIEYEKLRIKDGVTINLDTQKVYGDMDTELNYIITWLTRELARSGDKPEFRCRALKTILTKIFTNELTEQWAMLLKNRLKQTQMYNYYTQQS